MVKRWGDGVWLNDLAVVMREAVACPKASRVKAGWWPGHHGQITANLGLFCPSLSLRTRSCRFIRDQIIRDSARSLCSKPCALRAPPGQVKQWAALLCPWLHLSQSQTRWGCSQNPSGCGVSGGLVRVAPSACLKSQVAMRLRACLKVCILHTWIIKAWKWSRWMCVLFKHTVVNEAEVIFFQIVCVCVRVRVGWGRGWARGWSVESNFKRHLVSRCADECESPSCNWLQWKRNSFFLLFLKGFFYI